MKNLRYRLYRKKNKNRYDNFKLNFYKKVQSGFIKFQKIIKISIWLLTQIKI